MKKILSVILALVLLMAPCTMLAEETAAGVKMNSGITVDAENINAILAAIPDLGLGEEMNTMITAICSVINSLSTTAVIGGNGTRVALCMQGNELLHLTLLNEDGKLTLTSDMIPSVALELDMNDPKIQELVMSVLNVLSGIKLDDFAARVTADLGEWIGGVEMTMIAEATEVDFLGTFEDGIRFKLDGKDLAGLFEILVKELEATQGIPELIRFLGGDPDSVFAQIRNSLSDIGTSEDSIVVDVWQNSGAFRFTCLEKEEELFSAAFAAEGENISMILKLRNSTDSVYVTEKMLPAGDSVALAMEVLLDEGNKGYQAASETAGSRIITEDTVITVNEAGLLSDTVIVPMESAKDVIHTVTSLISGSDGSNLTSEIFYSPEQKKIIGAYLDLKQTDETVAADEGITETIGVLTLTDTAVQEKLTNALQNGVTGLTIRLIQSLPEDALTLLMSVNQ